MEERKQKSHITQATPSQQHQKVMSTNITTRMLQLLGLPALLYQPRVRTNLVLTVLYTQVNVMRLLFVTAKLAIDH